MRVTRFHKAAIAASLSVLALSGCGGGASAPPPVAPTVLPSMAASLSPAVYMALVSDAALFAVKASQLAETQSRDGRLRADAAAIAASQGGVASQLSYAGRRLDLLPSAQLSARGQADLAALQASGDFDGTYRRLVGQALSRALEAHLTFAQRGSSPTLKPVAGMAAPATRRDLDRIRR